MSGMSDYLEAAILNAILRNVPYASPNPVYVGLFTSWGDGDTPGSEVSGNGYSRAAGSFSAPVGGVCTNSGPSPITFPTPSGGGWGTVTHIGIYDAISLGNLLLHGKLGAPAVINADDAPQFPPGTLKVNLK